MFTITYQFATMADVEDAGMIGTFDDEEDDDDQGGSQWFNNTADEEIGKLNSKEQIYIHPEIR